MHQQPDHDRVALITGGGTGIGAATCQRLQAQGWSVAVSGRRPKPLTDTAATLAIVADITKPEDVEQMVSGTINQLGRLDALVCNAGAGATGTVTEQTPDVWDTALATNLTGAYLTCRSALPHLIKTRGAIVTVSSLAGLRAVPTSAAYCTSKAGLIMLTNCLALDYGPAGVRANCVCPGWARTPMADNEMDELGHQQQLADREDAYQLATAATPLQRPATADEIAAAITWLASAEASYVNGATLTVDGGTSIVDAGTLAFRDPDNRTPKRTPDTSAAPPNARL